MMRTKYRVRLAGQSACPTTWDRRFRLSTRSLDGLFSFLLLTILATAAFSQTADLAPVVSKLLSRTADVPGEFEPFLMVSLHARVAGYVEKVLVDRGSVVKQGELLAELSALDRKSTRLKS